MKVLPFEQRATGQGQWGALAGGLPSPLTGTDPRAQVKNEVQTLHDLLRSWAADGGSGSVALCCAPPHPLHLQLVALWGPASSHVCLQSQDLFP